MTDVPPLKKEQPIQKLEKQLDQIIKELGKLDRIKSSFESSSDKSRETSTNMSEALQKFYANLDELKNSTDKIQSHIKMALKKEAPDLSTAISHKIGDKLTAETDSLRKLTQRAESVVQKFSNTRSLQFYLIVGGIALSSICTSLGIFYFFPQKQVHQYQVPNDVIQRMDLGESAILAYREMTEKEKKRYMALVKKGHEKAIRHRLHK